MCGSLYFDIWIYMQVKYLNSVLKTNNCKLSLFYSTIEVSVLFINICFNVYQLDLFVLYSDVTVVWRVKKQFVVLLIST